MSGNAERARRRKGGGRGQAHSLKRLCVRRLALLFECVRAAYMCMCKCAAVCRTVSMSVCGSMVGCMLQARVCGSSLKGLPLKQKEMQIVTPPAKFGEG